MGIQASGESWEGNLVPVYQFRGYAYSQEMLPLNGSPVSSGAAFGNCLTPSEAYQIEGFGALGLFQDGITVCPIPDDSETPAPGDSTVACCLSGTCEMVTWDECAVSGGIVLYGVETCPQSACIAIIENPGPLEVLPSIIDAREESWTFLLRGVSPDSINVVNFVVGNDEYQGTLAETTTETSSLWAVSCPIADTTSAVAIDVSFDVGGTTHTSIVAIDCNREGPAAVSPYLRGQVMLTVQPNQMGFEPGEPQRSLCELVSTNEELERLLREVGVRYVQKMSPATPDSVTQVENRIGEMVPAHALLHRMYAVQFNKAHSCPAIARILFESSVVQEAKACRTGISTQFGVPPSYCPDANATDWWNQETIWGRDDPGDLDICRAWAQTLYGFGSYIAVVDMPINIDVPSFAWNIVEDPDYYWNNPWPDDMELPPGWSADPEHGNWVAGAAAGRLDDGCAVGVAPEAAIIPYGWASPMASSATIALYFASEYLISGDIVCCAWKVWEPDIIPSLEDVLQDLYDMGVTVVAASSGESPGNCSTVISVGGCESDGCLCTGYSADILAPATELYVPESWGGCAALMSQSTSSIPTALTAGFVALLQEHHFGSLSPSDVRDELLDYALSICGNDVLFPYGTLYQTTPVGSCVTYFTIEDDYENELYYANLYLDECSDIVSIELSSAISCWGPYSHRAWIPTNGGPCVNLGLEEPWAGQRSYWLHIVDDAGGIRDLYCEQ